MLKKKTISKEKVADRLNVKQKIASSEGEYKAAQITVLEGLDPVRKRPGMYIGSTGLTGLHHMLWEVIDNGIDEAMAGYATEIRITLLPDNMVEVTDNGRGIPVDKHKQVGVSALEVVMTKLHAGGKFGQGGYKVSGGLHGVGVSVVNALSVYMKAEIYRDGKIWLQEYVKGKPQKKVRPVGVTKKTGTIITFQPDASIFETLEFNFETILNHLRQQAYLTKGIKIQIFDERTKGNFTSYEFYFEGGIKSYVSHLNHNNIPKHENIFYIDRTIKLDNKEDAPKHGAVQVEIAFQYVDEYKECFYAFANNIINPDGGMHVIGFRSALTRVLNSYARNRGLLKEKDENLSGEDTREGITAVISVKVAEPQFEGQTKAKLGNPEVRTAVETVFTEGLEIFLEENPRDAETIIGKCFLSSQARRAARHVRESILRKGVLDGLTLPGKLADCSSRNAEKTELYIVEGDSAGGSAKQGRDRATQAILPLRGKILNVERARLDKMLVNSEIKALIIALGTNIGEQFDISKLRYHKIIIMTDADVDGAHIRTLLLTFFYRYFPELIRSGYIYIAQPPLYKLQKGKEIHWVYSDEEKNRLIEKMIGAKIDPKKIELADNGEMAEERGIGEKVAGVNIQRYKGLGEMNPDQLWETTMDPAQRSMWRVNIEEASTADEVFEMLMGSEVAPRKKFIQTHAKDVKNLDV